ncbi:UvrD-helicase domain-containing protein [Amycolatopsis carbonis]|uniref:UvrD-helicase domain-containing protein n=1 Tax=Amycolatopsis carbonis TaxID=715471 RepID=A0A9Y2IPP1_9PSEU|nr:UvrD-helicase domain-containing protein [Amycolatopsis sp. 2-15]WIX82881.1 UvrD-helicase domain-containing protein [Amycolatopsis sp. 2-15]
MATLEQRRAAARDRQQRAITQPAPLYVQACPGAGKTRVIVDRHLTSTRSGHRGRAVLSFTHVACDEVVRRCRDASQPHLATFPNFVGTIDTFLWRYLVRPFLSSDRTWNRIDSWDRISATVEVWDGKMPHTLRLSDFQWSREPDAAHCRAQLLFKVRNAKSYKTLESKGLLDAAAEQAIHRRNELARQGHVTGHEARIRALRALREQRNDAIALVAGRFDEIVIDEAQDCSGLDLAILAELRDANVPLVFVCDPDQAIYEFRGAQPDRVRTFGESLGSSIDLVGNWRSSAAICALAATLRPASVTRPKDDPVGPNHAEQDGILLIPADKAQDVHALAAFNAYAETRDIPAEHRLVLSHAAAKLPSTAQNTTLTPPDNYSARAAWAVRIMASDTAPTTLRETATEILERTILRYWYTDTDTELRTVGTACESLGVERSRLRILAARMASALPSPDSTPFVDWCAAGNSYLRTIPPDPAMTRRDNSGSLRNSASAATVVQALRRGAEPTPETRIRGSVIHQVKGEEEDAVLVVVPDDARTDALVDAWFSGVHSADVAESLRVLYVAATRARRLLALALPTAHCHELADYLKTKDVACEVLTPLT